MQSPVEGAKVNVTSQKARLYDSNAKHVFRSFFQNEFTSNGLKYVCGLYKGLDRKVRSRSGQRVRLMQ